MEFKTLNSPFMSAVKKRIEAKKKRVRRFIKAIVESKGYQQFSLGGNPPKQIKRKHNAKSRERIKEIIRRETCK